MSNWSDPNIASPLSDERVDRLYEAEGVIDTLPSLDIDVDDAVLVKQLDRRIEDSKTYFDKPDGFNLSQSRNEMQRQYLGKQIDVSHLYRFQVPYVENQIYVAEEATIAYATAKNPEAECYPAQNTLTSKKFAGDLEKALMAHSEMFNLRSLVESAVRDNRTKKVGFIELEYDPDYGKHGEIVPRVLNPENCVVDKNAALGELPEFFAIMTKMSVNEMCRRWPSKRTNIFETVGIKRRGTRNMEEEVVVRKVWLCNYDKNYKKKLCLVYYFGDLVLEKVKNPNWLHASPDKNFLPSQMIPVAALNMDNDGQHWIDMTTPIEQAMVMQNILNKRGRQMMELADKANGILIVSTVSGLTKDDLQNLTGDPNQRLLIKTEPGRSTSDAVFQVPPPVIPDYLMADKQDLRSTLHAIMGTPDDFTGIDIDDSGDNETLGQSLMKKNQASGRQDMLVRSIDRMMHQYFNLLVQMMVVWYDDKHMFVYNGGDGEFDYITMHRDLFEDGIAVTVKSGTTLPFDKQRQEAITLQLAKEELLAPIDIYKGLHMPNPQQLYDNWAKFKTDPVALARDAMDELDESEAFVAFKLLMNGKEPKDPDDVSREYVLSLRKLMLTDEFLKAPRKYQEKFLDFVDKALTGLELRMSLDEMAKVDVQELSPAVPIQPLMPQPQPQAPMPGQPMMPGGAPGMPPTAVPPGAGAPLLPGAPAGQPPAPAPGGSPMNGTPMVNPANPVLPGPNDVSALPTL